MDQRFFMKILADCFTENTEKKNKRMPLFETNNGHECVIVAKSGKSYRVVSLSYYNPSEIKIKFVSDIKTGKKEREASINGEAYLECEEISEILLQEKQ